MSKELDLDAIEARANAATPGPWKGDPEPPAIYIYGADGSPVADTMVPGKYGDGDSPEPVFEDGERGGVDAVLRLRGVGASKQRGPQSLVANYNFMIHARTDIPALVAEVRRLRAHVSDLESSPAGHRWSGWPGAWCLDCGAEDKREVCLADGHDIPCDKPECWNGACPTPGQNLCNPYVRK